MIALTRPNPNQPTQRPRIRFAPLAAALLTVIMAMPAAAQMSLQTAVLRATERDGNVAALRQTVASRSIDIQAARDEYYPSISLSGDSSTTDSNGAGITLTVSQVLYDWGLIRSKINAASHVRVQAVSDLKMEVEGLSLLVAEFFIDIEIIDLKIARTRGRRRIVPRQASVTTARSPAPGLRLPAPRISWRNWLQTAALPCRKSNFW